MIKAINIKEGMIVRNKAGGNPYYVQEIVRGVLGKRSHVDHYRGYVLFPENSTEDQDPSSISIPSASLTNTLSDEVYDNFFILRKDPMYLSEIDITNDTHITVLGQVNQTNIKKIDTYLSGSKTTPLRLPASTQNSKPVTLEKVQDMYLADAKELGLITPETYKALKDTVSTVQEALAKLDTKRPGIVSPKYQFASQYPNINVRQHADNSQYAHKVSQDPVIDFSRSIDWDQAKTERIIFSKTHKKLNSIFSEADGDLAFNDIAGGIELIITDPAYLGRSGYGLNEADKELVKTEMALSYDRISQKFAPAILKAELSKAVTAFSNSSRQTVQEKTIERLNPAQKGNKVLQKEIAIDMKEVAEKRPDAIKFG